MHHGVGCRVSGCGYRVYGVGITALQKMQEGEMHARCLLCAAWFRICCSVLQCVAVCCSVLQCVAGASHVLHGLGSSLSGLRSRV